MNDGNEKTTDESKVIFSQMLDIEISNCIDVTTKAFEEYEYFSIYIPDQIRRQKFVSNSVKVEYDVSKKSAIMFTAKLSGKIVGTAILFKPNYKKASILEYMLHGFWKGFFYGGFKDVLNWCIMSEKASAPCHERSQEEWYLDSITILPDYEGKGIGSRMLNECIIPYVRNNGGKKLCLFTNSEQNCEFYKYNGFEEFHQQYFTYNGSKLGSWSYSIVLQE